MRSLLLGLGRVGELLLLWVIGVRGSGRVVLWRRVNDEGLGSKSGSERMTHTGWHVRLGR